MLEEGDINTKTFQHWFVKFRTADFSLGNEPWMLAGKYRRQ